MRKAVLGLAKVTFIERWTFYRVATIDRFHCTSLAAQGYCSLRTESRSCFKVSRAVSFTNMVIGAAPCDLFYRGVLISR